MRRRRLAGTGFALFLVLTVLPLGFAPAGADPQERTFELFSGAHHLEDIDARSGNVEPTSQQKQAVAGMGANVVWNQFGTPKSLVKHGGFLANGLAGPDAATVARDWIGANKSLFRLTSTDGLALVNESQLVESDGYAVLFQQKFGGLDAAQDGKITVGVVGKPATGWKVASVSSSLTGDTTLTGSAALSPQEAWLKAAGDVGRAVPAGEIGPSKSDRGWTIFGARGFTEVQRARLVALPTPTDGVRPAFETLVLDNQGGEPTGYTHFIDAETGDVLVRRNLVHHSHPPADSFTGTMPQVTDGECDVDKGPWIVGPTESVSAVAATVFATLTTNDSVIHIVRNGTIVASQDTLFSPEGVVYEPEPGDDGQGTYHVRVCDFADGATWETPATYQGQVVFSPVGPVTGVPYPPKWKVFPAYPLPPTVVGYPWNVPSTDIRKVWCWDSVVQGTPVPGCDDEVKNTASRVPWDYNVSTSSPTFTTFGNNANTAESWSSPLTPGVFAFHPTSATRDYSYPWTNEWYNHPTLGGPNNDCVSSFTPGVSTDISAAVTNLFAMHNRMHDWSYHLGFTEENWNAQNHNFGNGGMELDALEGDAQAGAATGGYPAFTGRNNANMVPTPDGVPPITNMYLWQPWKGAIYDPCVDGDYDMTVIGHEYTHLIENRMIGKGGGRSGHHAGAMGESFSDLNGVEVLHEYSFLPVADENPFAVGAYVTGQKQRGIRNYAMNFPRTGAFPTPGLSPQTNPFNFGNMGYDASSTSPHADGEIWSAVNHDIRQALVSKYNASYPASNALLQRQCAEGLRTPDTCPGNRRWIQIMYDAFLLMPVAPTMLQARDAYLAADLMRTASSVDWPSNQNELWQAFARRGFGQNAFSTTGSALSTSDTDPRPDHESPNHGETTVTFNAVASNEGNAPVKARIYVGHYEARVSPIADTDPATNAPATTPPSTNNLDNVARFVAGTYEFLAHAKGYGHIRFTRTFTGSGSTTVNIPMPTNLASTSKGAVAIPGPGTQARPTDLIDDTEATNWEATGAPVNGRSITVDLAGTAPQRIGRVQVSAQNIQGQNRFTMLRKFRVETSTDGVNFTPVSGGNLPGGESVDNAFPGDVIRPLVPDMILRSFSFSPRFATHVRLVVLTNQCTGQARFQGVQDSDPLNATDCRTGQEGVDPPGSFAPQDRAVRAAELQVFTASTGAG